MNKILTFIIMVLALNFTTGALAQNQEQPAPVGDRMKKNLVDSISRDYYDWDEISLSGKLSSPMLPMSASVKVYMKKDELVLMSVSAPIVGEVARIEIDRDALLAVNKFSGTYSTVEMDVIEPLCPGGLSAVQNLLLGRISVLGSGQLSGRNASDVDIYAMEGGDWMVLPSQDLEGNPYVYYFTVSQASLLLNSFVVLSQDAQNYIEADYSMQPKGMDIDISASMGGRQLGASLKLNEPDSKTKRIDRMDMPGKYRQVSPRQLLK